MNLRNSGTHYGAVAQSLHWVTVVLVMTGWLLGTFGDDLPEGAARATGLFVHISAGLAVIAIVVLRLLWRIGNPPPTPERTPLGDWTDRAARFAHYALYVLLLAVPISGIFVQFARGDALPIFGVFDIVSPWSADRAFARSGKEFHELLANALVILVALHVGAALVHHWLFRDRTLLRMLPGSSRYI
jgi:cytochrome b561